MNVCGEGVDGVYGGDGLEDVKGDDGEALRRGVRDGFVVRKIVCCLGECVEVYCGVVEFGDEWICDCDDENVVV